MILHAPKTIANPTEKATTLLRVVESIRPLLICAALSAITTRAGSAMVVPKPIKKAKSSIHFIEPFFAKSPASPSPTGNIPTSNPCKNVVNPTATIANPIKVVTKLSGIVCKIRS